MTSTINRKWSIRARIGVTLLVVGIAGCSLTTDYSETGVDVVVSLSTGIRDSSALGTYTDIVEVSVDVRSTVDGSSYYSGFPLTMSPEGSYSGLLSGLPHGEILEFSVFAYDSSGATIFSGTTTSALTATGGIVVVPVAAIDGGTTSIPAVLRFLVPSTLRIGTSERVTVSLSQGVPGANLTYTRSVSESTGGSSTSSGAVTLDSAGNGTISDTVTVSTSGTTTYRIVVSDLAGNIAARSIELMAF